MIGRSRCFIFFKRLYNTVFCLLLVVGARSQDFKVKEIGSPFVEIYTVQESGGHSQNWSITEDNSGLMYFANTTGVLQFDGSNWQMVYRSDGYTTRSVCNCFGKIYVGGTSDLGVMEADSVGQLKFRSMLSKAPEEVKRAKSMWDAECANDGVYFRSYDYMFKYDPDNDSLSIFPAAKRFFGLSIAKGIAYTWDSGLGLVRFNNSGKEILVESTDVKFTGYEIAPFDGDTLLLNTNDGFYKVIGTELLKWDIPLRAEIPSRVYDIIDVRQAYTAMATLGDGALIMDRSGKLIQKVDKSLGLLTNRTYSIFLDSRNNLWLATNNGIVQIEINSPFTTFGKESGLDGSMIHIESTQNDLYVGGYEGLFRKPHRRPWQSLNQAPFQKMKNLDEPSWIFSKRGEDLLLGTNGQLLEVEGAGYKSIFRGNHIWVVLNGKNQNELVHGGSDGKFYYARKVNGSWRHMWQIKGISQFQDFMEEEEDGTIWLTDSGTGVFRFRLNARKDSVEWMTTYGPRQGLPDSLGNRVYRHKSGLKFITRKGVYKYDIQNDRFVMDPVFKDVLGDDYLFRFVEVPNGDIFLSSDNLGKAYLRRKGDGSYDIIARPFEKVQDLNTEFVRAFDAENVMVANRTGVLHYDPSYKKNVEEPFNSSVRKVIVTSKGDSLIYGGADTGNVPELVYEHNALKFFYSATYYDEADQLEFRSYLEGFEATWGNWTTSREKEYTNLPHGSYTFKTQAKNLYGVVGETAAYSFIVLPPWYFTLWAYASYLILITVFIWGLLKVNSRRLRNENLKLERTIQKRTEEIRSQKEQAEKDRELIKEQAEKLEELDKVKTRFFSNISHEFRTPLTLIKGPIEAILSGKASDKKTEKKNLQIAQRNSVMLQNLIDEILEFNRLETGKIELNRQPVFLHDFLSELGFNYEVLAGESQIKWSLDLTLPSNLKVDLDANKFEHILNNLISNAVKHTMKDGKIDLQVGYRDGAISTAVIDSGVGIEENELKHIFERFYQTFTGAQSEHSSGIGLAYVKEIIELMEGEIKVKSEVGIGTTFNFSIPAEELGLEQVATKEDKEIDLELPEKYPHSNNKILIVEDNTEMQNYIQQILSDEFELLKANNGKEALEAMEDFAPDLIISDIMMPVMDGMELLQHLKEDERLRFKSVIMLTAKSSQETKLEALQFGLDDYITKPFNPLELEIRVKNILGNQYERMQAILNNEDKDDQANGTSIDPLIEDLKSKIEENIGDSKFGVLHLSDHAALSDRQLTRIVKRATGLTPANLIKEVKLQRGKSFFEQKIYRTVAEVSYAVGFEKPSYFSKIYFERFGKKPSEYLL